MVRIRLKRGGKKNRPFYRVVAIDSRKRRDGKEIEILGYYNPLDRSENRIVLEEDKIIDWYFKGARASDTVYSLMKKKGIVAKITAKKLDLKKNKTSVGAATAPKQEEASVEENNQETPETQETTETENS